MSLNQFSLISSGLIQLWICQQRSDVFHTVSVWLNNIWAGRLSAVWRLLVMDGSWLQPLRIKNTVFVKAGLLGLYLLFFSDGSSPDCLWGFHLLRRRRDTQAGEDDWADSALDLISRRALSTTEVLPLKSLCDFWPFCGDGFLVAQSIVVLWGILWAIWGHDLSEKYSCRCDTAVESIEWFMDIFLQRYDWFSHSPWLPVFRSFHSF